MAIQKSATGQPSTTNETSLHARIWSELSCVARVAGEDAGPPTRLTEQRVRTDDGPLPVSVARQSAARPACAWWIAVVTVLLLIAGEVSLRVLGGNNSLFVFRLGAEKEGV